MQTQDPDLEMRFVKTILEEQGLFRRVAYVTPQMFSDKNLGGLWKVVCDNFGKGESVHIHTWLRNNRAALAKVGGETFVEKVLESTAEDPVTLTECADRIRELWQRRQIQTLASKMLMELKGGDKTPDEILSRTKDYADKVLMQRATTSQTKRAVAKKALTSALANKEIVTTGIDPLDFLMQGGLQRGRLYGIGGLYGRGKTILMGSISDNINLQERNHLVISLETDPQDIEIRVCAKHFNANASVLHDPQSENRKSLSEHIDNYIDVLPEHTVYEFSPGATINDIVRMILQAKLTHNIEGFMIDYWQLIRGRERGQKEEEHLRDVSNRLAALCRTENLWGVVTAQVENDGRLRVTDALLMATALYVRLEREEDATFAHFVVEKSNYTRYADTGNASIPGMIFDMSAGPHFRNTESMDAPLLSSLHPESQNRT